jgi:hypothetical protein
MWVRSYCEAPAGEFINPGHFNLLGHKHRKHRTKAHHSGGVLHKSKSSSSSSSDEEKAVASGGTLEPRVQADGTATSVDQTSPSASKRKSLLQRIIHH